MGPVSRGGASQVPQAVSRIRGQAVLHPDDAIGPKQPLDGEAEAAVAVASSDAAATRQRRPTHTGGHSTAVATVRTAQGRPDPDGTPHDALVGSALPWRAGPEMGDEPGHAPEP
jgi:hypothetical protein